MSNGASHLFAATKDFEQVIPEFVDVLVGRGIGATAALEEMRLL
jgi:hypothetical protein